MPDAPPPLTSPLGGRYAIERELGVGGMATVHLARDVRHDRPVAVKVLRPEIRSAIGAERFLQEVRITARLNHPRILPLLDSGDENGRLYYVMPCVEGESLRTRLTRERALDIDTATDIVTQVADALAYAHSQGVLHRDIKPENILLERGHALVSDFGIARAIDSADQHLTQTGVVIGTPAYMSPEQATGEGLDARSDVYSLGCVAYEMLTGEPPLAAGSARDVLRRRLTEDVPSLQVTVPSIPRRLDDAVRRALAREPRDRFASVDGFAAALKGATRDHARPADRADSSRSGRRTAALILVGGVVVTLAAGALLRSGSGPTSVAATPPRIAVLPFDNLGRDEDEPFADGVAEEISSRLAEISGLRVVSRTSARRFKGGQLSPAALGDSLAADFILDGTVRTDRPQEAATIARIAAALIRARDDSILWQRQFEASWVPGEMLRVQAEIASQVAAAMNVTLLEAERDRVGRAATTDSAAYRLYQLGRFHWSKRTPESLRRASDYFAEAIARDPNFAKAHAGLGDASFVRHLMVTPDSGRAGAAPAIMALRKALALDEGLAEAHAGLGYALMFANWDFAAADSALRRAIALDPMYAPAHFWYAQLLWLTGTLQEAMHEARAAVNADPLSPIAHFVVAMTAHAAGDTATALAGYLRALELQPTYPFASWYLAGIHARAGRLAEAEDALQAYFRNAFPDRSLADGRIRELTQFLAGRSRSSAIVRHLEAHQLHVGQGASAYLFAVAGMRDSALARFKGAIEAGSTQVVPVFPFMRAILGADPRWEEVEDRMGLGSDWRRRSQLAASSRSRGK